MVWFVCFIVSKILIVVVTLSVSLFVGLVYTYIFDFIGLAVETCWVAGPESFGLHMDLPLPVARC